MNYKRICVVLGAIFVLLCLILCINTTKENIIHKKQIESILNFSEEQKKSVNYKQLIADIKYIEDGKGIKYAKQQALNEDKRSI
ncbi:MAG: hypothetical protein IJH12_06125 [Clostridia bacterium]|nr:hypothetical protein [Clostridia bacterium]